MHSPQNDGKLFHALPGVRDVAKLKQTRRLLAEIVVY